MANLFNRKKTRNVRTSYNYRPNSSLSDQERAVNRRLLLSFLVIIGLAVSLYFWGIEIVIQFSNAWGQVFPNSQIYEPNSNGTDDSKVLFAPRLDPLPQYTNTDKVDIKGWAQPGVEVRILNNNSEVVTLLTDSSGRFEYSSAELIEESNEIYAVTINQEQSSEPSEKQNVVLDTQKPELASTVHTDSITEAGKISVTGSVEPGSEVHVNDRRVIIKNDNTFEYFHQLTDGANEIKVVAKDKAENETIVTQQVEYQAPASEEEGEETEAPVEEESTE